MFGESVKCENRDIYYIPWGYDSMEWEATVQYKELLLQISDSWQPYDEIL